MGCIEKIRGRLYTILQRRAPLRPCRSDSEDALGSAGPEPRVPSYWSDESNHSRAATEVTG